MFNEFKNVFIVQNKKNKKKLTHSLRAWQTHPSKIPIKQKAALECAINWESLYFIRAKQENNFPLQGPLKLRC